MTTGFNFSTVRPHAETLVVVQDAPTKKILLTVLSEGLHFPDWFGMNWDALNECLADLSEYALPGEVAIYHEVLPLVEEEDQFSTYLQVLKWALENHQGGSQTPLSVWFHESLQNDVLRALGA